MKRAWVVMVFGILVLPAAMAVAADNGGGNGGPPPGGKPGEGPHHPPPPVIGKFILAHADQLSLTDDQKQKIADRIKEIEAKGPKGPPPDGGTADGTGKPPKHGDGGGKHGDGTGAGGGGGGPGAHGDGPPKKGPFADILTDDQRNKLHELLKAEAPKGPPPEGGQGGPGGGPRKHQQN
ncbi:MAG TPA: hypothetical protein VGP72_24535 [Planctomycetota bacterium]